MKRFVLVLASASLAAVNLSAGNIVLTGHDSDLHSSGSIGAASAQVAAMIAFARSGAPTPSKPVLTFDHGSELTATLTALGIPFTNVDPDLGVPAASLFNVANFSAIAVASDQNCGGCDNTTTSSTNLAAASAAIAAFFNAGGGIVGMSAATNSNYYAFVPASASGFGSPPSTGYVQTAFGASVGIPAVNGNPTHNFFFEPGTSGVSAAYGVVERLGSAGTAETIACAGCTIAGGGFVGGGGGGGGSITLTNAHLPDAFLGVAYSQTLAASGGAGGPYTFRLHMVPGPINAGLTLSHAGVIAGTPVALGTSSFLVQITDSAGTSVYVPFGITVRAPTAHASTLAISTACPIPNGSTTSGTSFTFAATGGTAPYAWSISAGALPRPQVLASTGLLSGMAYHPGTYSFTVRVTDALGAVVDKSCSETITGTGASMRPIPEGEAMVVGAPDSGVATVDLKLNQTFDVEVTGTLRVAFTPEAGVDDSSVRFSNGSDHITFRIPAGTDRAVFDDNTIRLGSVRGQIDFLPTLKIAGESIPADVVTTVQVNQ